MRFRFRFRLFVADEYKPLRLVPPLMWVLTLGTLAAQILFSLYVLPPAEARQQDYEPPPGLSVFRIAALGEPETLAKLLAMRIQAFDNQPGISIPFAELNYDNLGLWLDRIVALDERAEYPHFLMAKIYSAIREPERRYKSVNWVRRQFLRDPNSRWWWMAHTTNYVKHIIQDDALALDMARDLRKHLDPAQVPAWPRQMEAFFLEGHDEFESAATILQNQLEAGEITDPQEFSFLIKRLEGIIETMYERGDITSRDQLEAQINRLETLHNEFLKQHGIEPETDA